jgi:hypothetical protein
MSNLSAHTGCLNLADSKMVLAYLKKPGVKGLWDEWSGEGGSDVEFKEKNVRRERLSTFRLPDYCPCSSVAVKETERHRSESLGIEILGGNDWIPPEYGGDTDVRFWIVDPVLKWPVFVALSKTTDWRFYGRPFNESVGIWIYVSPAEGDQPLARSPRMTYGPPPGIDAILKFFKDLTEVHSLPDENSKGLLETRVQLATPTKPVFEHQFEIGMFGELRGLVQEMVTKMIRDSMSDFYSVQGFAGIGGTAWFHGEMHNVREDALAFLRKIAHVNDYPEYDITYHSLGPRSWKDREKSRKKWKKPIHEDLGTATLENGAVVKVSLGIEKEGYIFYLNLGSDDDYIKFYHSKLFQKTKWHSGAE